MKLELEFHASSGEIKSVSNFTQCMNNLSDIKIVTMRRNRISIINLSIIFTQKNSQVEFNCFFTQKVLLLIYELQNTKKANFLKEFHA